LGGYLCLAKPLINDALAGFRVAFRQAARPLRGRESVG